MSSSDSDTAGKVVGMPSEQVVDMPRNGWTASTGIGGRHGPDYAVEEILLGMKEQSSEFVELVIVGAVGSFQVGILLGMALVVLDEPAAKARE
jgi:hypothetical protein